MLTLAYDTTLAELSVALFDNDNLLFAASVHRARATSVLFELFQQALDKAGKNFDDIDLIVSTRGPGSFTGVRVGLSVLKGIIYARPSLNMVVVSTLEAMAASFPVEGKLIFPVINAKRNQFYGAMFRYREGKLERLTEDAIFNPVDIIKIADRVVFVGDAVKKLGLAYVPLNVLAVHLARLGIGMAAGGRFSAVSDLSPVYLRLSDAEEKKGVVVTEDS